MNYVANIEPSGIVTIPKEVRSALDINPEGDEITLDIIEKGKVFLRRRGAK